MFKNTSPIYFIPIWVIIFVLLVIPNIGESQEVPVPQNHLVNKFIERHITLGNIDQSELGVRPFTYSNIRKMLNQLAIISENLSNKDRKLLQRFSSEFSTTQFDRNIKFPLEKKNLKNVAKTLFGKYQLDGSEPHFLSFQDTSIYAWANLGETVTLESIDKSVYRRFTDNISILGSISEQLSFYVNFSINRFVGDSSLVYEIEDFKNEDHPYFDFVNWTLWYQSNAAFHISTKYGNFQLGKTPVIWGFSPNNSTILSGSAQSSPFFNYSFKNKYIGFHFLHGSLLTYESSLIHKLEESSQKYIAAHRIELYPNEDLTLSFNEMVIYGNRPFEVEYLIPVNFYWPAEHNQGDKDNLLMAVDCSWRIKPGLIWYNTLFWDELAWEKVLTKWWANKFIFQSGLHWTSKYNSLLPDLRIEATVSRPWTYTHDDYVNSYTSAGIGLGLPQGPNSQSLLVKAGFWPSYRWYINLSSMIMKKGSGLGSSPLDNYNLRDRALDDNTPYLLGEIQNSAELRLETNYSINRIIDLFGLISIKYPNSEYGGYLGMTIDW